MEIDKFIANTPCYVFDFDKAKNRVAEIKSRLPKNATLCYAIKANPFLLRALKDEDILFEVCSEGELEICKKLSVAPEKIVFSGVMKNQAMIKKAVEYGVKTITFESLNHLSDLIAVLPENKTQEVIIRLNDNIHQFGMSTEDVEEAVKIICNHKNLVLRGIHFFTGTQKKIKKIEEEITFIEEFCKNLIKKYALNFNSIEYGPGLSFDYFGAKNFTDNFDDLEAFSDCIKNSTFDYVIELGRFIASPCGEYFTKICDLKSAGGSNYIIIDGGINHINYYGQVMAMKLPPIEHLKTSAVSASATAANTSSASVSASSDGWTLCGSLCTTADIITKNIPLENPKIGDTLVFKNIGAYSITEGIYLFLSHDLPAVYGKNGDSVVELRGGRTTFDLNC